MGYSVDRGVTDITLGAAVQDLRTHQFKAVRVTASGVDLTAAVDANSGQVFVLQNKPNSGQQCQVAAGGQVTKAVAGGAIPVNAVVTINTSAAFIEGSYANIASEIHAGTCLEAADADGDVFALLLK